MNDRPENNEEEFDGTTPDLGLVTFEELQGICERHIKNDNEPFTEDEFAEIVAWVENTRLNESLLSLVLRGKLDVIFDKDRTTPYSDDESGLLFAMTKWAKEEIEDLLDVAGIENIHDIPPIGLTPELDFGDETEH